MARSWPVGVGGTGLVANGSAVTRHRRTASGVVGESTRSVVRFDTTDVAVPDAAVERVFGGVLAVPPATLVRAGRRAVGDR